MLSNKLVVRINKPITEVFEFTTNPENTSKWFDSITKEKIDGISVSVGTRYRNWNKEGELKEYTVSAYKKNRIFQLNSDSSDYKVRYTYIPISEKETELEYFEWDERNELQEPFTQKELEKLKVVMEAE